MNNNMQPTTFSSRRVENVSYVLAATQNVCKPAFRTCVHCAEEVERVQLLVCCEDCLLLLYCSEACRRQDRTSHLRKGNCRRIATALRRQRKAVDEFNRHRAGAARVAWYERRFGNEFTGRNFDALITGRWSEDPFYEPILHRMYELGLEYARHPHSARALETSLANLLILKAEAYLADPYNLDVLISALLLKLYREDDAVSVIIHWLDWRSRGPNIDNLRENVVWWDRAQNIWRWPYPIIQSARFEDVVERFRSFPAELVGVSVPIEFALVIFVIKMRFITAYRKLAADPTALGFDAAGFGRQQQPVMDTHDVQSYVFSFLAENGYEYGKYLEQLEHVELLMDYIDERDATLLPALVDPTTWVVRNILQVMRIADQTSFYTFLQDYSNGQPVIDEIKFLLMERYLHRIVDFSACSAFWIAYAGLLLVVGVPPILIFTSFVVEYATRAPVKVRRGIL